MLRVIVALLMLAWPVCVSAQHQNTWYLGKGAGLDFNSGSPVAITDGRTGEGLISSHDVEGTSGICDNQGAILFYSDGSRVWNKTHAVMKNGDNILSDPSSSQSSIILPKPGSGNLFYLFTTDDFFFNKLKFGFRYSVIDMCDDNGLGGVIQGQKNVLLLDTVTEKLTAVKHANGTDYWVIIHKYLSDAFYAYKLSASGISPPVISHAGSVHGVVTAFGVTAIGQMKASPDGTRLALAVGNSMNCLKELFNFDKTTGVVSGFINLNVNGHHNGYGISFSPDNSKLYISHILNSNAIAQYDLLAGGGHPDSIKNSRYDILPPILRAPHGIQLGPDGKIYVAHRTAFLSVINNPNARGAACNYTQETLSLKGKSANYGMPNMVDGFNYPNITPGVNVSLGNDTLLCSMTPLLLKPRDTYPNYLWNTGDTTPSISIQSPGKYWLKVGSGVCQSTDTIIIGLAPLPKVNLGNDTTLCAQTSLQLLADVPGATRYTWSTTESTQGIRVNTSGQYWVEASNGSCHSRDSIIVTFRPSSVGLSLGPDTSYCFHHSITLHASVSALPDSFLWNTQAKTSAINASGPGIYWVDVAKWGCMYRDSVILSRNPFPQINLGINRKICKTDSIVLDAGNSGSTYLWSNQATSQTQSVRAPGTFKVTVTNALGCSDSAGITLDTFASPSVFLGRDTFVCEGSTFVFDAGADWKTYLWQDSSADRKMEASSAGSFHVVVTDSNNCRAEDEVVLSIKKLPVPDLGDRIPACNPDLTLKPKEEYITYTWQDGSNTPFYHVTDYGVYTLQVTDANYCVGSTEVEVINNCPPDLFVPNAFSPNGDANNDLFYPVIRNIKRINWRVYNRWGELVFQTDELNKAWDGTYKGRPAASDVYVYQVTYSGISEEIFQLSGNVTLLR